MARINTTSVANQRPRLHKIVTHYMQALVRTEAASGAWLIAAAAIALVWSNSPWAHTYEQILQHPFGVVWGPVEFRRSLEWFINDGLMVLFFFVVGLEIRLEVHAGELAAWRRAALPVLAALGGMLAPALIYLAAAGGSETRAGWAIPTATDIAFAVGIIALLGKRVPRSLRILLLALAIIDDVGAIIVIALFYSAGLSLSGIAVAWLGIIGILFLQSMRVSQKWVYVLPAGVLWLGAYMAGIHPTLAGVVVGLMTPVEDEAGRSPAQALLHSLHPWVTFGIMPVFALANAGVVLGDIQFDIGARSVLWGVCLGLVLGKPLGIIGVTLAGLKLGFVRLPRNLTPRHVVVLGSVAGIGFTMSLFVAQLAFPASHLLSAARLSIVLASAGAAVGSLGLGYVLLRPAPVHATGAQQPHTAEC
jgi:NhaA family Na+:H+ antiporter